MHVTRILNSTAHGPELTHSEEWEQWNVLPISKMCLVTEKRQIRCNDPGARTLVTVRKMKPAAVSQAFQITEAQPWQQHSLSTTPTSVTLQHRTAAHSAVEHLWSKCTIYSHGWWTSELIPETDSKSSWHLSHHCRNTSLMQPGASSIPASNQPGCLIETWQVPYRSWPIM